MKILILINKFLANMLPSLRISPLFLVRITTIGLFCAVTLSIFVIYIQSIGSGIGNYGGVFNLSLNDQNIETNLLLVGAFDINLLSQLLLSSAPLVKINRLTKDEQSKFTLTDDIKANAIGLMLGDLYIYKQRVNAKLCFKQSMIHSEYLFHLFELFEDYCPSVPKIKSLAPDKRTGKVYDSLYFNTYSLPCFNELYKLFYPEGNKVVPLNIADLLTPSGLCYWICDDGYWNNNATFLCTNAFSLEEVNLLVSVLTEKFNLKCSILRQRNGYVIRISSHSMSHLHSLVGSIIPPMMRYKVFGKS